VEDYQFINLNIHHNGVTENGQSTCNRGQNPGCYGIYNRNDHFKGLIEGCEIHDNDGYGIVSIDGALTVRNNKIFNNGRGNPNHGGVQAIYQEGSVWYNNLIYNNNNMGIWASNGIELYNNTIYGNGGAGIQATDGGTVVRNNIVYRNGGEDINLSGGNASNNLTSDPLFANPSQGDFHLTSGSPAIDAGISLPEVPTDFEGTPRPQGSAYDIGADEYGSGVSSSPTPTPLPSGTNCSQYTSSSQIPQGFAVPWDVQNPSIMLVSANCTPPMLLLKAGDPNTTKTIYVYKDGYVAPSGGSSWTPVQLFGSSLISGAWYKSSAQGVTNIPDPTKATYYVAYTCTWTGSKWMCGCRDAACSQSYWQLQKIQ